MGYFMDAGDLRTLLAVAGKLRALASEAATQVDRDLYLTAAAALEARANWLASTLPEDRDAGRTFGHRPVDLLI
jgi:hypothetical protein